MSAVLQKYEELKDDAKIRPDPDQEAALSRLAKLESELILYDARRHKSSGLLGRLFSGQTESVPRGVYFYGGVGRGKSMIMDLFYNHVDLDQKRRVHFHAFMLEVHDRLHKLRQDKAADLEEVLDHIARDIAKDVVLLCFDEFHVVDVADAMILGRLFKALFENGVVIVATSNWALDDLYKDGLQRSRFLPFIALFKEKLDVHHFTGAEDYRLNRIRKTGVYFTPLNRKTNQQVDELFTELTDQEEVQSMTLDIKGHQVIVPAYAKNCARFTFDDLCEKPLGAVDYLEIVQYFKVIVIEGVPHLTDELRNETRRFMTLIDTLYENKITVIVSAEKPPEKLYKGKENDYTFERTVSRLLEMQSESYLAGN